MGQASIPRSVARRHERGKGRVLLEYIPCMRVRSSFQVHASIQKTYAYLSDPRHFASLGRADGIGIALDSEVASGPGTRYRVTINEPPSSEGTWYIELLDADPPNWRRVKVWRDSHAEKVSFVTYRLTSIAAETVVGTTAASSRTAEATSAN
jgi:hypothetical protein